MAWTHRRPAPGARCSRTRGWRGPSSVSSAAGSSAGCSGSPACPSGSSSGSSTRRRRPRAARSATLHVGVARRRGGGGRRSPTAARSSPTSGRASRWRRPAPRRHGRRSGRGSSRSGSRRIGSPRRRPWRTSTSRSRRSRRSTTRRRCARALERIGLPAVLKTRRGGYDGKGQARAAIGRRRRRRVGRARRRAAASSKRSSRSSVSCRSSRCAGLDGTTACYPLVETEHDGRDLARRHARRRHASAPPARRRPAAIAGRLLDELEYVGVLARRAVRHDGELLANELAPRVHNSGHWTIEGAETSQFENHLRAVLGWPLGSTRGAGPQRDGERTRHAARPGGGAARPGGAPPRLREGATPRPQGRPRHGHRRAPPRRATTASRALRSIVEGWTCHPSADRAGLVQGVGSSSAVNPQSAERAVRVLARHGRPGSGARRLVREKRGAGAGWSTPSNSTTVSRALMCGCSAASLIVSTGAKQASRASRSAHHSSRGLDRNSSVNRSRSVGHPDRSICFGSPVVARGRSPRAARRRTAARARPTAM